MYLLYLGTVPQKYDNLGDFCNRVLQSWVPRTWELQEILSKINKQNKQQTKKIVSFHIAQRSLELSISFRLASNS